MIPRCAAICQTTSKRCSLPAAESSDLCVQHGRRLPSTPDPLYRKTFTDEEWKRFEELRGNLDVRAELAAVRVKLETFLAGLEGTLTADQMESFSRFTARIATVAETVKRTLDGITLKLEMPSELDLKAVISVIQKYVPAERWDELAVELRQKLE